MARLCQPSPPAGGSEAEGGPLQPAEAVGYGRLPPQHLPGQRRPVSSIFTSVILMSNQLRRPGECTAASSSHRMRWDLQRQLCS